MEIEAGYSRKRSARIQFNVSDSSLEEMSTTTSGNTTSIKNFNLELKKYRSNIISELTKLSKEINLAIWIVYGLYSFTWYLIGIQWLPDPYWGIEINCNIPELEKAHWSFYEKRNLSSPPYKVYEPGCVYYDYQYAHLASLTFEEAEEVIKALPKKPAILYCKNPKIEYDVPKEMTHRREFELYCRRITMQVSKFYVHVGVFLLGFPTGLLADIYGRRPVNNFCAVLFCISAFVIPLSPNFVIFAMATSFFGGTLYVINMLLGIIYSELFRNKYRGLNTLLAFAWFYVGSSHPGTIYRIVEVWRLRKLTVALTTLIIVFGAIVITPESPRLLLTKRQFKSAWDCLHELGCPETSDVPNYVIPKLNIKYQLKIFTKSYLLHRIYAVVLLNLVATFFYYIFKYMSRTIIKPTPLLSTEMLGIQGILVALTGSLMFFYSRKALICIYYILLSLSILINMLADSDIIMDVGALAGQDFSAILFILTIIYGLEVFPTSHRATGMGLYLTANHTLQSLSKAFIDDLVSQDISAIFSAFYCGLCMICALITVMIPDTGEDIPDRKEDLFLPLSARNSNLDIVTDLYII